jgi:hypothetical protein
VQDAGAVTQRFFPEKKLKPAGVVNSQIHSTVQRDGAWKKQRDFKKNSNEIQNLFCSITFCARFIDNQTPSSVGTKSCCEATSPGNR